MSNSSENLGARDVIELLVQQAAIGLVQKQLVMSFVDVICSYGDEEEKPLHALLMNAAVEVKKREERVKFVCRVITRVNRLGGSQHILPKQLVTKETTSLIDPGLRGAQWAMSLPALMKGVSPGPLKLAWLMASELGFGARAIDGFFLVGPRVLRADLALCVPISKHDEKHAHIIWLPEQLRTELDACLKQTRRFKNKKELDAALRKELKKSTRAFDNGRLVSVKDTSRSAQMLRQALAMGELSLEKLTVAVLIEVARAHGVAKTMPGYLRDMLNQTVLPTSTDRMSLLSVAPRPPPQSPNHNASKPSRTEKMRSQQGAEADEQYIEALSTADGLPEVIWSEWEVVTQTWVRTAIGAERPKSELEKSMVSSIEEAAHIGRNSWCAWAMQFLCQQKVKKGWKDSTWLRYRSQLLPPELSAFVSAVDVEEFDEEDLYALIDMLEQRGNSVTTVRSYISLILRMIRYAQVHQPDFAFPQISLLEADGQLQRNRRAHILSPGEIESLVDRLRAQRRISEALVVALIGFAGMRPIEIMYLRKANITLLPDALEINIERSKTPAGKRCLPIHALAPKSVHEFLLNEFRRLISEGEGEELFFGSEAPKTIRREELITPALDCLRDVYSDGIDLYTLRHSFASWSFLRMSMSALNDGVLLESSPNLRHEIFNEGLNAFVGLIYQQSSHVQDPNSFYRLARLMGHATPETLPRTYIHTAGWLHSAWLYGIRMASVTRVRRIGCYI